MRGAAVVVVLALVSCAGQGSAPAPSKPTAEVAPPAEAAEPEGTGTAWGPPVESPEEEAAVLAYFTALAEGRGEEVSGDSITIGPGLWAQIAAEPELAGLGIPVIGRMAIGDETFMFDGRGFRNEEMATVMTAPIFRAIGQSYAKGEIRAATAIERQAVYAFISWEILGQPLTVAKYGDFTLVVQFLDGVVWHLDLIEPMTHFLQTGDTSVFITQ